MIGLTAIAIGVYYTFVFILKVSQMILINDFFRLTNTFKIVNNQFKSRCERQTVLLMEF